MPYGKGWQPPAPLAGYPHRRSGISLPLSLAGVVRFVRMTACGNMPSRMRLHTHPFSVYRPPGYGQMPSAIPRNAFMRKGCEGSLSSSENKGGHKKASSAHTKSRSHPAPNRKTAVGSVLQQAEGPRFGGPFPFRRKILPLEERARTAPPTFFTQRHEDRIRNSHNGSCAPGPAPQCGSRAGRARRTDPAPFRQ